MKIQLTDSKSNGYSITNLYDGRILVGMDNVDEIVLEKEDVKELIKALQFLIDL